MPCQEFQSTHPSWGATIRCPVIPHLILYFNPRTHRGVRLCSGSLKGTERQFQSTHPSWGATKVCTNSNSINIISIHAPIVGCDEEEGSPYYESNISIHAPIVGCDGRRLIYYSRSTFISIHAPIVGCDSH